MDPTEYDTQVLAITSEITKQVFPFTLDLDHPRMREGLERLNRLNLAGLAARERGGLFGHAQRLACAAGMGLEFVRLYFLPTRPNEVPQDVRLSPAW
jgi:magnesium-protoporphyrin IX monomethyl ester (oxidative) cyclase